METKKIVCPECNLNMEYWTRNHYIQCTKCGATIAVEPYKEETEEKTLDDLLNEGVIFVEEAWTEEPGDYWWEYYEDDDCTKRIEDIDQFVKDYNTSKLETKNDG